MKSYNEMAECVFERRDQYSAARAATRKKVQKFTAGAICCCLVAVLGVGVMHDNQNPVAPAPEQAYVENLRGDEFPHKELAPSETKAKWQTATDILSSDKGYMGVSIPTFLSYQGGFYGITDDGKSKIVGYSSIGEVWFSPEYRHTAYQVEGHPDCLAVVINGGLRMYQKIFDVTFELEGVIYGIQYSPTIGSELTAGEEILSDDGFTVYETAEEDKYLVNILPLLQQKWPGLFGEEENYKEAWQVALPLSKTTPDVPVANVPGSTGALAPYEEVWGGSYTDQQGNQVVLLTENTPENQQEVFKRNPTLNAETTIFNTADYSLSYLTELLAEISKAMGDGELPFVPTAGLYEDRNRVVVAVTTEASDNIAKILAFDTLGGAIEIRQGSGLITNDFLSK